MFCLKEVILLTLAFAVLDTKNRTTRDINEHIVGGAAPTEQVKTVVAILNHGRPVCSGTVIDNTWVISAGHCFTDANLDDMKVVAGEMDMRAYFQGFSTTAKTVGLKNLHLPENYWRIPGTAKVIENDLALVELTESLQISQHANIEAAALPPPGMKITGENITVVGWGKEGQYSPQSPSLLSTEVTIRQDQDCLTTHGVTNFSPNRMFCGGSKTGTTCTYSGGGAVFHGWGVPVILGVVSFGNDTPTVYTRITAFLPWIIGMTNIKHLDVCTDAGYLNKYLDNVADPPSILYLSASKQVWLPSLLPVEGCSVPPYPRPSLGGAVSGIVNKKLTICGGCNHDNAISKCYSLDHGKWWLQQPLITERWYAGASMSPAGIIITGGVDASAYYLSSTEVLTGEGWVAGPDMPVAVAGNCQVSVGSRVYVSGGHTPSGPYTAVYALDGQEWTEITNMKYARYGHSCAVLGNNLFLIGGFGARFGKSVEIFNLLYKTWDHEAAALTSALSDGHALVHDGRLYAFHTDGEVERLAADMSGWEVVGSVGEWGVSRYDRRPFHSAPVLTRQMLNC